MKTLIIIIITFFPSLLLSQTLLLKGEETSQRFVKIEQVSQDGYIFESCQGSIKNLNCEALFSDDPIFNRKDLISLVHRNARNGQLAMGADIALVAGSIYIGIALAAKFTVVALAGKVSLDGGVAGLSGILYGTVPGGVSGGVIVSKIDALDPFIHFDMAKSFKAAIGIASEGDLEDLESYLDDEFRILIIEDFSFAQLKEKLKAQLASLQPIR